MKHEDLFPLRGDARGCLSSLALGQVGEVSPYSPSSCVVGGQSNLISRV